MKRREGKKIESEKEQKTKKIKKGKVLKKDEKGGENEFKNRANSRR